MKTAAIYCRVSSEDQEKEGTSLQSQLEGCKKLASEKDYNVNDDYTIQEVFSGFILDRPDLARLRTWIYSGEIQAVIIYDSDRFSRDGYDFLTLIKDCGKTNVELLCVLEPIETGALGELMSFIRGWASKREAEKIRERNMRGKKTRMQVYGKLAAGNACHLYGYRYIAGREKGEGIRVIDETTSEVVRKIFKWYAEGCLTLHEICRRLVAEGIPSPRGNKFWGNSTIARMLVNEAYVGNTYALTPKKN